MSSPGFALGVRSSSSYEAKPDNGDIVEENRSCVCWTQIRTKRRDPSPSRWNETKFGAFSRHLRNCPNRGPTGPRAPRRPRRWIGGHGNHDRSGFELAIVRLRSQRGGICLFSQITQVLAWMAVRQSEGWEACTEYGVYRSTSIGLKSTSLATLEDYTLQSWKIPFHGAVSIFASYNHGRVVPSS